MAGGLKQFLLRGNVVDLAVGVVVGAAFGAVVTELTKDLLTPMIAAVVGKPDFSAIQFEVNGQQSFWIGNFLNAIISFLLVATAVYYFRGGPRKRPHCEDKESIRRRPILTTKKCPECLSEIPIPAKRCAFCTSQIA